MKTGKATKRDAMRVTVPAILVTLVGFVVAYQFVEPAPPKVLEVATGPEEGAYYRVARLLKDLLAEEGLTLNVRATKGSIENIGLLSRARDAEGAVDVAFVQGGTGTEWRDSLQSISSMYFEPV